MKINHVASKYDLTEIEATNDDGDIFMIFLENEKVIESICYQNGYKIAVTEGQLREILVKFRLKWLLGVEIKSSDKFMYFPCLYTYKTLIKLQTPLEIREYEFNQSSYFKLFPSSEFQSKTTGEKVTNSLIYLNKIKLIDGYIHCQSKEELTRILRDAGFNILWS